MLKAVDGVKLFKIKFLIDLHILHTINRIMVPRYSLCQSFNSWYLTHSWFVSSGLEVFVNNCCDTIASRQWVLGLVGGDKQVAPRLSCFIFYVWTSWSITHNCSVGRLDDGNKNLNVHLFVFLLYFDMLSWKQLAAQQLRQLI